MSSTAFVLEYVSPDHDVPVKSSAMISLRVPISLLTIAYAHFFFRPKTVSSALVASAAWIVAFEVIAGAPRVEQDHRRKNPTRIVRILNPCFMTVLLSAAPECSSASLGNPLSFR